MTLTSVEIFTTDNLKRPNITIQDRIGHTYSVTHVMLHSNRGNTDKLQPVPETTI